MLKKILLIILFNFFFLNPSFSQNKIAFIDLDSVIQNSKPGNKILQELNLLSKNNLDEIQKLQVELEKQEQSIQTKKNIISEEDYNKQLSSLRKKIAEYRKMKDIKSNDFNKIKNQKITNFFNNVNPIIQKYMDDNSLDLLFDRKNVFIGKVNSDITEDIISLIDKNYK